MAESQVPYVLPGSKRDIRHISSFGDIQFNSSSTPFECSAGSLTYKGYSRESIANLHTLLFPKCKSTRLNLANRPKDWWEAQLRFYGLKQTSSTITSMAKVLQDALSIGLQAPPPYLVQLEDMVVDDFKREKAQEANRKYLAADDDDGKARANPRRFLAEKFARNEGEETDDLVVLKVDSFARLKVHEAAKPLGLHTVSADAPGALKRRWLIVGRVHGSVVKRKYEIERERAKWEEDRRSAKRLKLEAKLLEVEGLRQQCDTDVEVIYLDVEGEWSIQCEAIDEYEINISEKSMSIFFHPVTEGGSSEEYSCDADSSEEEEEEEKEQEENEEEKEQEEHEEGERKEQVEETVDKSTPSSVRLCGNFRMGILEGIIRSSSELSTATILPLTDVLFTWRGRDTGTGQIQLDKDGSINKGNLIFLSKTKFTGLLKSKFGDFAFAGSKVSNLPAKKDYGWDEFDEYAYDERMSGFRRWGEGC